MKYQRINNKLFINNRKNLIKQLKPNSIVILNSNDILPTNADGLMPFKQNNDLFYLTGIEQEETILLLFPDSPEEKFKEILFIRDVNEELTLWEGDKLTVKEASDISGINTVRFLPEFDDILNYLTSDAEHIYLNSNEHKRAAVEVETRDDRFIKKCKAKYPLHNYCRIAPLIYRLRARKSDIEINLMKKACELTEKGFRRILSFVKPGVTETEVEAEFIHEFIRNNGAPADYEPIIASGIDSCTLHYTKNNKTCKDGDVLLIDFAASYANYNADMTRTIPVNGKYTARQKRVYNAVLRVLKETRKLLKPGARLLKIFEKNRALIEKELIDLGLLKIADIKKQNPDKPFSSKYYPHNVSHFLGLDVHDVGYFDEPLAPGMVITCEPGIYIREEGFGIRLENNILINQNGNTDLFENIPIEADEIEDLMNSK
jgi:Xaa-Pro aminopeptidase